MNKLLLLIVLIGLMGKPGSLFSNSEDKSTYEISPHSGFMGSGGLFGIKVAMNYNAYTMEMAAEQVIGESANLYPISLNGAIDLTKKGNAIPYGIVGGGMMLAVSDNAVGAEAVTVPMLNFGAGLRYYFSSSFGFRFEARQFFTSVTNKIYKSKEILIFQETTLGFIFVL